MVMACLALILHGCGGCDEDTALKCYADNMASQCVGFSKCLKDKSCCDTEAAAGGKTSKGKDLTKTFCDVEKLANKPSTDECA